MTDAPISDKQPSEIEVNHDVFSGLPYDREEIDPGNYSADFLNPTVQSLVTPDAGRLARAIEKPGTPERPTTNSKIREGLRPR